MTIEELRQDASQSSMEDDTADLDSSSSIRLPAKMKFLGMTPSQTFIIAALLLLITCLLSTFCLVATGKVALPFF
jgi:hypothetical protein